MAYLLLHNLFFHQCDLVVQVAFRAKAVFLAEVLPVLVDVRQFLCASRVSADSLRCHFGMEGSRLFDIYKLLPGVFQSQPSPFYAKNTERLASSHLGLRREVS
jgi:hypothetical protein